MTVNDDAKLPSKMLSQFTLFSKWKRWMEEHVPFTILCQYWAYPILNLHSLWIIIMSVTRHSVLTPVGSVLCQHCHMTPETITAKNYLHRWGNSGSERLRTCLPLLKSTTGAWTTLSHPHFPYSISKSIFSPLGRWSTFFYLLAINKFPQEKSVYILFNWKH